MERKKCFIKFIVVGAIFLLLLPSIQGVLGENLNLEPIESDEENSIDTLDTHHYTDCTVIIFGKCGSVGGALTWIFGFYAPIFKKDIWISASGETLSAVVVGGGFGVFISVENLYISMTGTRGFLFWAGKSVVIEGKNIIGVCRADYCTIVS